MLEASTTKDLQHMNYWITNFHRWTAKHFWRKFAVLTKELDASIDMPMKIIIPSCQQANGSHVSNQQQTLMEVSYG
jgi:hypothetical protein